jgi:hypothetical protein
MSISPSHIAAALSVCFSSGKTTAEVLREATNRALADYRSKHRAPEPLAIEMLLTADQLREPNREETP